MKYFHFVIAIAMVVAILASPVKGETWVVLAKPGMEVVGTFELEEGGMVNVDVDTRQQCLKLFEITDYVPSDLGGLITREWSVSEGIPVVTITIDKDKVIEGFTDQKYIYHGGIVKRLVLGDLEIIKEPL